MNSSNRSITPDQMIQAQEINEKFNLFIRYSTQESPLFESVLLLGAGFVALGIVYFSCMRLLPKLSPKSGILIGTYEGKYRGYENAVRLVVFAGVYGSILAFIVENVLRLMF